MKLLVLIPAFLFSFASVFAQSWNIWEQTNGPSNTRLNSIAADSSGNLYAAQTYPGHIYKSTDNGQTWNKITKQPLGYFVNNLIADANGFLYLFTDNASIFISSDQGQSWEKCVSQTNPIYASFISPNGYLFCFSSSSFFYSTDRGGSWQSKPFDFNSNIIYFRYYQADSIEYADASGQVMRSGNMGESWQPANKTFTDSVKLSRSSAYYVDANGRSYCLFVKNFINQLAYSDNDFKSWGVIALDSSENNYSIINTVIFMRSGNLVVFTPNIVYRFTSMAQKPEIIRQSDVTSAFFNAIMAKNGYLYVTEGSQLAFSADEGSTWVNPDKGFEINSCVYDMIQDRTGNIFAISDNIFKTKNRGENWSFVYGSKEYSDFCIDSKNGDYYASLYKSIVRSDDKGLSWHCIRTIKDTIVWGLAEFNGIIYLTLITGRVQASSDHGASWYDFDQLNPSISNFITDSSGHHYAVGGQRNMAGRLWKSTDNGLSWTDLGLTFPEFASLNVRAAAVHPDSLIFVSTNGNGVYISSDEGASWTQSVEGIQSRDLDVWDLAISVRYGYIYIATPGGVYRSVDKGRSWSLYNLGLQNNIIHSLLISPDGFIYAGTDSNGVYRTINPVASADDDPVSGPIIPITVDYNESGLTLGITVSDYALIKGTLTDVLGRRISSFEGYGKPGPNRFKFEAGKGLSAGIYLISIQLDGKTYIKKFIKG